MTRRFLAATLGLTVVVLLVLVVPLGLSFSERERDDLLARVERDAVAIAFFVEDELDPLAVDAGVDLTAVADGYEAGTGGRVVIVDRTGIALADSEPPTADGGVGRDFSTRPEIATALTGTVARGTRLSSTLDDRLVFVAVPVASGGEVDGAVRITYPSAEVDERVRRNWLVLGSLSGVTLAAAAVVSIVLSTSVTRPLHRLQGAAAALGAGDLTSRAPVAGPPEMREVADAFNRMAARLEELVTAQDHFVADASHELRTPLTALKLRLEMLEGPDADAALREVDRLARLVAGLLALARADRGDQLEPAQRVPLGRLLEERRDAWEPVAADAEVTLEVADTSGLAVVATEDRVTQVLDNLIANAIDATPAGGSVRLTATAEDDRVAVHVIDDGPGLDEDQRERAFDRFWRAGSSRGGLGGSGLGLAIVKKLAVADGADAALGVAPGGGVDAVVRYPRG